MTTAFVDDNEAARVLMEKLMRVIDPSGTHYTVESAVKAIELLSDHKTDVVFMDIEMPGINGIEAAQYIEKTFPKTNVVFVSGHPEYALDALKVYCSGFIEKPFDEDDIREALRHLRHPVDDDKPLKVRCTGHFAVFMNDVQFTFKRKLTMELFAYLVYKNGAMCTNGELLGILWDGDPDKGDHLRQLVKDMRDSFSNAGIDDIVVKRHGSLGLNTKAYILKGDPAELSEEYHWL